MKNTLFKKMVCLILITFCALQLVCVKNALAMPFYDLQPKNLVLRSEFFTSYASSSIERKHNIALATKSINGTFIDVGGEFSFNRVVGERSEKRGYKTAKIISYGEFVDGVGGGVCQVSTTLYNACLLADLKVLEYHPHTLPVGYVSPSFDAMVSFGTADLKIKNTTHNPVILYAKADGERVTIKVYGEPLDEKIIRKSVVTEMVNPSTPEEFVDDKGEYPNLLEGEKMTIRYPKQGLRSQGYLIRQRKGKIRLEKIRTDFYRPIRGLVVIGTALLPQNLENEQQ